MENSPNASIAKRRDILKAEITMPDATEDVQLTLEADNVPLNEDLEHTMPEIVDEQLEMNIAAPPLIDDSFIAPEAEEPFPTYEGLYDVSQELADNDIEAEEPSELIAEHGDSEAAESVFEDAVEAFEDSTEAFVSAEQSSDPAEISQVPTKEEPEHFAPSLHTPISEQASIEDRAEAEGSHEYKEDFAQFQTEAEVADERMVEEQAADKDRIENDQAETKERLSVRSASPLPELQLGPEYPSEVSRHVSIDSASGLERNVFAEEFKAHITDKAPANDGKTTTSDM